MCEIKLIKQLLILLFLSLAIILPANAAPANNGLQDNFSAGKAAIGLPQEVTADSGKAYWFSSALDTLRQQGLTDELQDFAPEKQISGQTLIKLMVRAIDGPGQDDPIALAKSFGWLKEEEIDKLNEPVSRGEMALITYRALNKVTPPDGILKSKLPNDMNREDSLSGYILRGMSEGLFNGYPDGTFRPRQSATYAEAVAAISRLMNLANPEYVLPVGFTYLDDVIPDAYYEIRYYGDYNFVGQQVDGYQTHRTVLTEPAAEALLQVHQALLKKGLGLKIYDAYRPQRAVAHFVRWARDLDDTRMKEFFYPDVDKANLFELGYIAEKSGHSRGSTVDLTVIRLDTGEELDMGSGFDFFGPISHHDTTLINEQQQQNRRLLRDLMEQYGFNAYAEEWWHYTLKEEPYPDQYFDFPICNG